MNGSGEPRQPSRRAGSWDLVLASADEATNRALVPLLRLGGCEVRSARGQAEALAACAAALPDVLIAEAELADGMGYGVVKALRELPRGEAPAALVLGSRRGGCNHAAAIYAGADVALDHPVAWSVLARELAHVLGTRPEAPFRVLAVDHDPAHSAFVRAVLEGAGYEVRCCAEPCLLGAELDVFRPHLLLMGMVLPDSTGYGLVRALRRSERHAALPILFMTHQAQVQDRIDALRAGGDEHLVKPVPAPLLVSAVEARIERSRRLQALLEHDGLTRLLNQAAFFERARAVAARAQEGVSCPAVWAMIDFDRFKSINDRFGHAAGDRVLATAAAFLRRHVRRRDLVGRCGGEELGVVFEGLAPADVGRLIDRIRREFAAFSFPVHGGSRFRATFSAGVAPWRRGMSWEEWREAADRALYAAKEAGRNRVVLAGDGRGRSAARLRLAPLRAVV